jgi:hypothetical protein
VEASQTNSSEDVRREVHAFLGELNGAVYQIVVVNPRAYGSGDGEDHEWDHLVRALRECEGFAQAHDALNTGEYDETLIAHGLGGDQGSFKFSGWRSRLKALYRTVKRGFRPARRALGWANSILESLAAIPGVGAIKEITGLLERLLAEREEGPGEDETGAQDRQSGRGTSKLPRREVR